MDGPGDNTTQTSFRSAMIVDDHPLFCDALSMTLKVVAGVHEISTAERLETALAKLDAEPRPDLILLDLSLPDVSGLDGLIRLKTASGDIPILVASSMADNRMIASTLRAGASGFVPKHSERETFRTAIETLARGEIFTPEGYVAVGEQPPASDPGSAIERLSLLTYQQARILQLICEGKLNKQIAYDLSIAETTVKAHVTAIMRKLGVQSRTQAVLIAKDASFANVLPNQADQA